MNLKFFFQNYTPVCEFKNKNCREPWTVNCQGWEKFLKNLENSHTLKFFNFSKVLKIINILQKMDHDEKLI